MSENQNDVPQKVEGAKGEVPVQNDVVQGGRDSQVNPNVASPNEISAVVGAFNGAINAIARTNESKKDEYHCKEKKAKYESQASSEESRNNAEADKTRYKASSAKVSDITKSDMTSKDKANVINKVSDNDVEIERIRQENITKREEIKQQQETLRSANEAKHNTIQRAITVGGLAFTAIGGLLSWLLSKRGSNGSQMNLMTMDNLIMKVPVKSELEHHYFEVLRAMGEMEALKNEEKELWSQLQQLKKILEVLILKGTYGTKLGTGAAALKRLLNEIKNDPNGTGRWMKNLDSEKSGELYHQAQEICAYLDGRMER